MTPISNLAIVDLDLVISRPSHALINYYGVSQTFAVLRNRSLPQMTGVEFLLPLGIAATTRCRTPQTLLQSQTAQETWSVESPKRLIVALRPMRLHC